MKLKILLLKIMKKESGEEMYHEDKIDVSECDCLEAEEELEDGGKDGRVDHLGAKPRA